jgi:hypothetical protein
MLWPISSAIQEKYRQYTGNVAVLHQQMAEGHPDVLRATLRMSAPIAETVTNKAMGHPSRDS